MNWTEMLTAEAEEAYRATLGMLDLVDEDALGWKPATGDNWMTTGQLLSHLTSACGYCCRAFVTGDWGTPDGQDLAEMSDEEMLPSADKMPTAESLLDRGAQSIATDLQEDPLVQARLMSVMGKAYYSMGLYAKAEPLFVEALRIYGDRLVSCCDPLLGVRRHHLDELAARGVFEQQE